MMELLINRTFSRPFSYIGLLCAIALLGACSGDYIPRIPAFENSGKADEEIKSSSSHMESKEPMKFEPVAKTTPRTITRARINPKNMFGKDLRTDEERIDRLERAVQDMRHEFNTVTPSIRRLMAVEGDIQELIVELRKLSDDPSLASLLPKTRTVKAPRAVKAPQVQQPKPVAKAAPKKSIQRKMAPPVQNGKASVYDIRIGEHPGKTRIVLDVNTKTGFTTDIDNGEKIMIVELPKASWDAATSQNFGKSSFISSYKVEPSGDGQLLIFQLKRDAKISYKADIGGTGGSSRRIVIDLSGS